VDILFLVMIHILRNGITGTGHHQARQDQRGGNYTDHETSNNNTSNNSEKVEAGSGLSETLLSDVRAIVSIASAVGSIVSSGAITRLERASTNRGLAHVGLTERGARADGGKGNTTSTEDTSRAGQTGVGLITKALINGMVT